MIKTLAAAALWLFAVPIVAGAAPMAIYTDQAAWLAAVTAAGLTPEAPTDVTVTNDEITDEFTVPYPRTAVTTFYPALSALPLVLFSEIAIDLGAPLTLTYNLNLAFANPVDGFAFNYSGDYDLLDLSLNGEDVLLSGSGSGFIGILGPLTEVDLAPPFGIFNDDVNEGLSFSDLTVAVTPAPEPSALAAFAVGVVLLGFVRRVWPERCCPKL